jgi:phosphatidylserine/phosphatidylglycerophosphate/cardiolipin synthase-like enzyme
MMKVMKPQAFLLTLCFLPAGAADLVLDHAAVQVFFSPHGGCTDAVVAEIAGARRSILVQAYAFTSMPIAAALKTAHDHGVDVRVIFDKSQTRDQHSDFAYVQAAGIPVWIDTVHGIAHSKVMVLDGATVITGSFNFTKAAEGSNAENLLVIHDSGLAALYTRNWRNRLERSVAAPGPAANLGKD